MRSRTVLSILHFTPRIHVFWCCQPGISASCQFGDLETIKLNKCESECESERESESESEPESAPANLNLNPVS